MFNKVNLYLNNTKFTENIHINIYIYMFLTLPKRINSARGET